MEITGYVERITFRNEENGYTVLQLITGGEHLCCVGTVGVISEGETVKIAGEKIVHPVYGPQFQIESLSVEEPTDAYSIERYLCAANIKGIGEKMAHKIVQKFGDDTFRILEEEPERLAEIKGLSERKAMEISDQIVEKRETRNALLYLQKYDISISLAMKIFKEYGRDMYRVLEENPYQLADRIRGVGFQTVDQIARNMNIGIDSEFRVQSGIVYILNNALADGHTYLLQEGLLLKTEALLGVSIADFRHTLEEMEIDKRIRQVKSGDENRVYLRYVYIAERNAAQRLHDLNLYDETVKDQDVEENLRFLKDEKHLALDEAQGLAIETAMRNGITIVTGGPGTGKTTTIKGLIELFCREGMEVALAAPTGRAAKRMSEATGCEAKTIHRLLEVHPSGDESMNVFNRNENHPLEADVLIVDEMSMVDLFLLHALLKAVVPGMRLIFVGDADQLPSVGPGEILRDLILSDCFPVVKLTTIYRQSEDSDIIVNAHKINEGEMVEDRPSKDFLFVHREDAGHIVGATRTLLLEKLPAYIGASTRDMQVLTPMRKGPLGVEELNPVLQSFFNPPAVGKKEKTSGGTVFRVGDKVMQIKNDYNLEWTIYHPEGNEYGAGIYNGDIGIITDISDFEEKITVVFDEDKVVDYPFASLDELELSYAITIHKSQGSEYPAIVLPLLDGPSMLMTRRLLYTAVTRAKQCVCIVGRYEMFCRMIQSVDRNHRMTGFMEAIRATYEDT